MGGETINAPKDIVETFNSHFASVGENSSETPPSSVELDTYVVQDKITFSVKMQGAGTIPRHLFLIYINDLSNCLNRPSPRMFSDDTNISIAANSVMELNY